MIPIDQVLARSLDLVSRYAANKSQGQLLNQAIVVQSRHKKPFAAYIASKLTLLVYSAIQIERPPPDDLSAAVLVHMLGRALLDDLADGDVAPEFHREDPAQLQLLGVGLFSIMPQLILLGIEANPAVALECQRCFLTAITRMGAGQQLDLLFRTKRESDLQAAWNCIDLKSGSVIRMLAELGAIAAAASESQQQHYSEFGNALGCQWSLAGDWNNLMQGSTSEDLKNGTHTYPLTLWFSALSRTEKERLATLLDDARANAASREEVRDRLKQTPVCKMLNFAIESCVQRAIRNLDLARPLEPARSMLVAEFFGWRNIGA